MSIAVAAYRESFLPILNRVLKVVPNSKTVLALNYIRVDVLADLSVQLTATDLLTSLTVKAPAKGSAEGSFLIPARDFQACLSGITVKQFVFACGENSVRLAAGNTKWSWPSLSVDQFPKIAAWSESVSHTLKKNHLISAFRHVRPATREDSLSSNLQQIGIRKGFVQAADGIRFHETLLPDAEGVDVAFPLPFVSDLIAVLSNMPEEEIELGIPASGEALIVRCGDYTFMSKTRTEKFPDVSQAFKIPALSNETPLKVGRSALATAVSRVGVVSDPSTRAVRLRLSADHLGAVVVSSKQRDGSWAEESVPADWTGGDRTLTFNLDYLLNLLALFDTHHEVTLKLGVDQKHKPSTVLIQHGGSSGVLNQLQMEWA